MTPQELLDLELSERPEGARTVREYLVKLLGQLWEQGSNFSGKRPYGDSGWEYDLYVPMVRAGFVAGFIDRDGDLEELDRRTAHRLVAEAIQLLGHTGEGSGSMVM